MGSLSHERKIDTFASFPSSIHSSLSSSNSSLSAPGAKCIEHNVSKLDTLAGIAIKYGVEVADIKRINGLVTDLQMFAHKSLLIPLPGRHPPSPPIPYNGSVENRDWSPTCHPQRDVLDSLQSLKLKSHQRCEISSAMSSLQRYYGLPQQKKGPTAEGTEMTVYRTGDVLSFDEKPLPKVSPASEPQAKRSTGLVRSFLPENGELGKDSLVGKPGDASDSEKSKPDKSVRRRQKADADPLSTPEAAIKDGSKGPLGSLGRGLAPKPMIVNQTDTESARQSTGSLEEPLVANGFLAVRKSSSTSSLQEPENDSIWTPPKWTLKPDTITRPILSGLPKQITVWRSKAALD